MSLSQDLAYQAVGVITVIGSLAIIAIVLTILGKFLQKPPAKPATKPETAGVGKVDAPATASSQAAEAEAVPWQIHVAIVAAVHTVLGPRAKILEIHQHGESSRQLWSMEGRRQIFQSHKIR